MCATVEVKMIAMVIQEWRLRILGIFWSIGRIISLWCRTCKVSGNEYCLRSVCEGASGKSIAKCVNIRLNI